MAPCLARCRQRQQRPEMRAASSMPYTRPQQYSRDCERTRVGLGRDETVHVRSQAPESAGREKRPGDRRCIRAPFLFLSLPVSTKSGARAMACKTLQKPSIPIWPAVWSLEESMGGLAHRWSRAPDSDCTKPCDQTTAEIRRSISLISAHNFECG
jgi:hypothetical protein